DRLRTTERPRHPQTRRAVRAERGARGGLGALFDELFRLALRNAGRDERRLQILRDRLLRDRALGDVLARRELEHHVQQSVLDDRPQPARAGLTLERLVGDLPERVISKDEL